MTAITNHPAQQANVPKEEEATTAQKWIHVVKTVAVALAILVGVSLCLSPFIAFPLASAGVISVGAYKLVCACWIGLAPIGLGLILGSMSRDF